MAGVESAADRLELLSDDDFGEEVRLVGVAIPAVWYAPYSEVLGTEGSGPSIMVRTADVPDIAHGQEVKRTVGGVTSDYTVRGVQSDGTGMSRVILEEQ